MVGGRGAPLEVVSVTCGAGEPALEGGWLRALETPTGRPAPLTPSTFALEGNVPFPAKSMIA